MNPQQQSFDPMAQLMELLNYQLKQKQLRQQGELGGRELDIRENQGGRELDLRGQQMQQQGQQFETGLGWDREQAVMRQQQFNAEMQQKMLERAMEQSRFAQTNPTQMAFMQAQTDNLNRLPTVENDPRMAMMKSEEQNQIMEYLQNQIMTAPDAISAGQARQQLDAYVRQRFGSQIPPPPPLTLEQQNILKSTQQ